MPVLTRKVLIRGTLKLTIEIKDKEYVVIKVKEIKRETEREREREERVRRREYLCILARILGIAIAAYAMERISCFDWPCCCIISTHT